MNDTHKIKGKIVAIEVVKRAAEAQAEAPAAPVSILHMSEKIERPDILEARVYKIKPGEHAFYITISDIWLNKGTEHETCRPYELFINTKDMAAFQWIALASRLISAVMRKGGDLTFILEEMKAVFDPSGGFFQKGEYVPSIVAAIGGVLEEHMAFLGLLEKKEIKLKAEPEEPKAPKQPQCPKCLSFSVIVQEGCTLCGNCGYSKCG